jgi:V8-like Glu-specific endopeptidase
MGPLHEFRRKERIMASTDKPMTLEELARLPHVPDGEPPPELGVTRTFLSAAHGSGRREALKISGTAPEVHLHPVKSAPNGRVTGWEVPADTFTYGLNVARADVAPLPHRKADAPQELEAFVPKWSGIDYLPRLADPVHPQTVRTLRRRNGKRVRPEYVFGVDNRVVYYPSGYPWRCIGRIFVWPNAANVSPSWSGTAALISKNAILTCSHMAPWASISAKIPWKALFVAGYYDGASVNGPGASAWVSGLWGYKDYSQGDDMAVMALTSSLGAWLGYFGYKTYTEAWEDEPWWTLCGYPGMVAGSERPSRQSSVPIQDEDNDGAGVELEYEADSSPGNSGGPLFGWWSGKPYIIGTHSGGRRRPLTRTTSRRAVRRSRR